MDEVEATDAFLIERISAGDLDAFLHFYTRYERYVIAVCLRITGDRMGAEDAAQDTWMKVKVNAHRYRADHGGRAYESCRPWLGTIARNESISWLRRRGPEGPVVSPLRPSREQGPEERVVEKVRIHECLRRLREHNAKWYQAFLLRHYSDLKWKDVAAVMGEPLPTVERWAKDGLGVMTECLAESED